MRPFEERYRAALADENVSTGLLDFQRSWRETRDGRFADLEADTGHSFASLRRQLAAAKDAVVGNLDQSISTFREAAEAAGATVVEVSTAEEANAYIAGLCRERGIELVVKGKSMTSEEIGLNEHLASAGVEAVETDLGEWILQLAGDRPSHLVMPAIHLRRHQVAELLGRALGEEFDADDIPAMVRSARTALRERFLSAGMGVTGANALISESGSIVLVTNEGNGQLTASLPALHVAIVGVEKIVPDFATAMTQLRLLARSATGQSISTYTTFITGPTPGHELHIVLLDNGRRQMAADAEFSAALRCIRCGACANVCPSYQVVGGQAFGHIYTGPIGLVATPFHHGFEAAAGPQSLCLSCGACESVCPVEIPLPRQIIELRQRVAEVVPPRWWTRLAIRAYASRRLVGAAARVLALAALPWRRGRFTRLPLLPGMRRQLSWRTPPAIPLRPARSRSGLRTSEPPLVQTDASGRRVTLFLQCITDRLAPEIAVATATLLRAAGCDVVVPDDQHCCGLPAFDAGDRRTAARMAKQTIETLESAGDIVTPAPSCLVAMLHDYDQIFRDDPAWRERGRRVAERVYDVTAYLSGPARFPDGALSTGDRSPVTVHRFCQATNTLGRDDMVAELIEQVCGVEAVPLSEAEVCCGFGGSTSAIAPEMSEGVVARKLENVAATGAHTLVTDNPGCILHLRGAADAAGLDLQVLHVAEYLAACVPLVREARLSG
ncbi:MAG: LUD domain-containing protein [Dehalococcoidia bacterium]